MKIFFILFVGWVMGCGMSTSNSSQEKELAHVNGLYFKFTGSFANIQQTDHGYIIYVSPEDGRQADQIVVQYRNERPNNLEMVKEIQGQRIYYRENSQDVGSGGSEETLELWKETGQGRGVYVEHYRQSEERADFSDTWALMVSAR